MEVMEEEAIEEKILRRIDAMAALELAALGLVNPHKRWKQI